MKLSKNFNLSEFTASKTATERGIKNVPGTIEIENMRILCTRVLQPLRDEYGEPMRVSSGYRCSVLNRAVGGANTSQHLTGEAADITVADPRRLLSVLLSLGMFFDQAILYPTFLHISYRSGKNRKQVLYAKGVQP